MLGVVMDGDDASRGAVQVSEADGLQIVLRPLVVTGAYPELQPFAWIEPDTVRSDLDVEFVNLARRERFPPVVGVVGLPGF